MFAGGKALRLSEVVFLTVDPRLGMLGDQSLYRPDDQRWNKNEMLAAKMDKFLAVSIN
jgi:hypothetical protein